MRNVLVFAGTKAGNLTKSALEALGAGSLIAGELGEQLGAVIIGADTSAAVKQAIEAGAQQVFTVENPCLAVFQPDFLVAGLEAAVTQAQPRIIILCGDSAGRELGPRLAASLKVAVVTEVTDFKVNNGIIDWIRPVYGGKAMAVYTSKQEQQVICLRPRIQEVASLDSSRQGEVIKVTLNIDESIAASRVIEKIQEAVTGIKLEDARVIVAGGRGLGGKEAFKQLEELATVLRGTVGSSRAACDAGWAPPSWQVGQTGTIVAPDIYIAIGISGASQHIAGISGAKTVIAINTDAEAPIFKRANLGIVADFKTVLPTLKDTISKALDL